MPDVEVPWETLEVVVRGRETARVWEGLGVGVCVVWGCEGVKVWVELILELVLEDECGGMCVCCCWRDDPDTKVGPRVEPAPVLGTGLWFSTLLAGTILLLRKKKKI